MAVATLVHNSSSKFGNATSLRILFRYVKNCKDIYKRPVTSAMCHMEKKKITVTFVNYKETEKFTVSGPENSSLLELVQDNDLFDGFGICGGDLSCCSCHVILSQKDYDELPKPQIHEEIDMLDSAPAQTPTSRLGCQVRVSKEFDGLCVKVSPEGSGERLEEVEEKLRKEAENSVKS